MRNLEDRDKVVAPQSACLNSSKKVDIAAMRPRRTECRSRKESEVGTDADAPRAREGGSAKPQVSAGKREGGTRPERGGARSAAAARQPPGPPRRARH